jgi:glycosyltransferase involved in cell wall biosynthesis
VISTYVAGIPELVEPGIDGWLVPAGSVQALTDAMRAALGSSTTELERLGNAGRARVHERHHVRIEVDKLLALLEASIAGRAVTASSPAAPGGRALRA